MELRERLNRLGYFKGPPAPGSETPRERPVETDRLARPAVLDRPPPSRQRPPDLGDVLAGAVRESDHGGCFVAEARFPLDHVHGGIVLSDMLGQGGDALALLGSDPRLGEFDPRRAVFLDVETTGLAGGTGTYLFLIGLGYFADGAFRVDQFFLREPGEERAMLSSLSAALAPFEAIVTFNGKCFDWPLVETRHIYNRVALRPAAPLHLDLLFPSRRLFKRRLGACTLTALEPGALEMPERQGDVPGWLIPTIYFDYLRYRDARPLAPVFTHNRLDILTMVALAVKMARHVGDPMATGPAHPVDLYSLGRLFEDLDRFDRAVQCYERSLAVPSAELDRAEALARLSGVYKRLDERDRAVALWEQLIGAGAASIYPYVELAKHLEHRVRQHGRALDVARQAMDRHHAARPFVSAPRWRSDRANLDRRLARLERKLSGQLHQGRSPALVATHPT